MHREGTALQRMKGREQSRPFSKTDAKSNCEYFASRCLATGHNYTGTAEAGTCTRASPEN